MHPFIWEANALHVFLWDASIVIAETQQDISICLWRLLGTDFPPELQAICGFLCCYDERVTKNTEKEGLFCLTVSGEGSSLSWQGGMGEQVSSWQCAWLGKNSFSHFGGPGSGE